MKVVLLLSIEVDLVHEVLAFLTERAGPGHEMSFVSPLAAELDSLMRNTPPSSSPRELAAELERLRRGDPMEAS